MMVMDNQLWGLLADERTFSMASFIPGSHFSTES